MSTIDTLETDASKEDGNTVATKTTTDRKKVTSEPAKKFDRVVIPALDEGMVAFDIVGTTPLVIHRMSSKVGEKLKKIQEEGSTSRTKKVREKRDFEADYRAAMYTSPEGWHGIHAASFRNAAIRACSVTGFVMTRAKLSIFCEPDGFDAETARPLVRITEGEPEMSIEPVRNSNTSTDLRSRPLWRAGWRMTVRMRFDRGQFELKDVVNLMDRCGKQVGVGEGRHSSKNSAGVGWGCFRIDSVVDISSQLTEDWHSEYRNV